MCLADTNIRGSGAAANAARALQARQRQNRRQGAPPPLSQPGAGGDGESPTITQQAGRAQGGARRPRSLQIGV